MPTIEVRVYRERCKQLLETMLEQHFVMLDSVGYLKKAMETEVHELSEDKAKLLLDFLLRKTSLESGETGLDSDNMLQVVYRDIDFDRKGLVVLPTIVDNKDQFLTSLHRLSYLARRDSRLNVAVVLDGDESKFADIANEVASMFKQDSLKGVVVFTRYNVGYVRAIKKVLNFVDKDLSLEVLGFYDDDAFPLQDDHFTTMFHHLAQDNVGAVSGLCVDGNRKELVHGFFNIASNEGLWRRIKSAGFDLHKPFIHGGGGACLVKKSLFIESLDMALQWGTLLGPTISVVGRMKGMRVGAFSSSLVKHPTKTSFKKWLLMVVKYYRSWSRLMNQLPRMREEYRTFSDNQRKVFEHVMTQEEYNMYILMTRFRKSFRKYV